MQWASRIRSMRTAGLASRVWHTDMVTGGARGMSVTPKGSRQCAHASWETPHHNMLGRKEEVFAGAGLRRAVLSTYRRQGFAPLDKPATQAELNEVNEYLTKRIADKHPGNVSDSEGNIRAVHGYDSGFCPSLMDRLGVMACEFIGCESVYVFQFRINVKFPTKTGTAGAWVPHRDFDFWHNMDGMPAPNAALMHLCVNEHHLSNGPVLCCDGSHLEDIQPSVNEEDGWEAGFREDLKYQVEEKTVKAWPRHTAMMGPAGTIFAMHPKLWHYSHPNTSPEPRILMSIIFSDTRNVCMLPEGMQERPEFIARLAPNARGGHWTKPTGL